MNDAVWGYLLVMVPLLLIFLYCVFLFIRKEIREASPGWWRPRWSWIYTRKKDMPPEIDGPKWWEKEAR